MNKFFTLAVAVLAAVFYSTTMAAEPQEDKVATGKILIAYFSKTGNTAEIAKQIQAAVGGDLFKIETVTAYPADYRATTEVAKKEQQDNARPALTAKVENFADYNVIFLGYPNWWGTLPMPLFTFLESYDFAGKTIIPFCTHGGSALGRSESDIKKIAPSATLCEGLAVRSGDVKTAQNVVAAWLKKLGF